MTKYLQATSSDFRPSRVTAVLYVPGGQSILPPADVPGRYIVPFVLAGLISRLTGKTVHFWDWKRDGGFALFRLSSERGS